MSIHTIGYIFSSFCNRKVCSHTHILKHVRAQAAVHATAYILESIYALIYISVRSEYDVKSGVQSSTSDRITKLSGGTSRTIPVAHGFWRILFSHSLKCNMICFTDTSSRRADNDSFWYIPLRQEWSCFELLAYHQCVFLCAILEAFPHQSQQCFVDDLCSLTSRLYCRTFITLLIDPCSMLPAPTVKYRPNGQPIMEKKCISYESLLYISHSGMSPNPRYLCLIKYAADFL